MSTDVYTVRPNDLVNLAASIMDWEQIRHIPVEDDEGKLVGLVSHRDLLKLLAESTSIDRSASVPVHMIMKREVLTVDADAPVLEALKMMRENKVGCLPVVRTGKLVGIITVYDFLALSVSLLEEELKQ
jgi:CBS domain-containing protein